MVWEAIIPYTYSMHCIILVIRSLKKNHRKNTRFRYVYIEFSNKESENTLHK